MKAAADSRTTRRNKVPAYVLALEDKLSGYLPEAQVARVRRAYEVGALAHKGQTRRSGEPYITHPIAVAGILAELGMDVETIIAADPAWLAEGLTDFGFDRNLYTFARDGFAPFREEYKAACINLGRRVTFDLPEGGQGAGEAIDVDEEGRLVVRTDSGEVHVFTGEVSVHGIYGAV